MAHRKSQVPTIIVEDIAELIESVRDNVLPNAIDPTQFIIPSISGTIDPFTEEITFHESETLWNASGIIGAVMEEDMIFGLNGQIQIGDVKVTYPYEAVSGMLPHESVDQVKLLSPGVSGLYQIAGRIFDVIGNNPVFVDYALKPLGTTRTDG